MFFNDYKVLKQRIIQNAILTTDNAITTSNTVDKFGKRIYQSVNTSGIYNYSSYLSYNMEVPSIKTRFFGNINFYGGKGINFVNLEKNITHNNTYAAGVGGYFSRENKMNINLRTNISYNTSVSSINEAIKTAYWVHSYNIDTYFELPYKFDLSSDANLNFRQKTNVFDQNRNSIIWNASLAKRLFKETCSLKFSLNDILDQNIGFRRDIQSNFITENTYATLRRFHGKLYLNAKQRTNENP